MVRSNFYHDRRVMEGGHQVWLDRIRRQCHKSVKVDAKEKTFQWVNAHACLKDWIQGALPARASAETALSEQFRRDVLATPGVKVTLRTPPKLRSQSTEPEYHYRLLRGVKAMRNHFSEYLCPCLCFRCLPRRDKKQTDLVLFLESTLFCSGQDFSSRVQCCLLFQKAW